MRRHLMLEAFALVALTLAVLGCAQPEQVVSESELTDDEVENLVRRSYQYVAMYNVINKNAMVYASQTETDGWNLCIADTALKDHTYQAIARPNNDTLYAGCLLDLRTEPVIVEYPAFDSEYVSLETSAYDHYCDIPLSTTKGDFEEPTRILYYTERTEGYSGEPVEGVHVVQEMTGDFAIAFLRVMPHAAEPERMAKNLAAMKEVTARKLSEYRGEPGAPAADPGFPAVGETDFDIFENNFLDVIQFVFNHTTFDPNDSMDRAALEALRPLGVEPGNVYDPESAGRVVGEALAETARRIHQEALATWNRPEGNPYVYDVFKPKGEMTIDAMVVQSAYGPIGLPAHQAVYPAIVTADGNAMNAQNDYVIRMTKDEMPPAEAFWSVTLYDSKNGWFIPNDQKKYSVGKNAGYRLDDDGGIEIYIAAEQPEGVPEENWLPILRRDEPLDAVMRIYAPDLERLETWETPKAERVE